MTKSKDFVQGSGVDRRAVLRAAGYASLGGLVVTACGTQTSSASASFFAGGGASAASASDSSSLAWDHAAWNYDATNDVYWQLGRSYVTKPAATDYEVLGIYVPGRYLSATKNSDGTYTATVDSSGKVGDFTAATAPIVFPVNTPGYAAQQPPSSYSYDTVSSFMKAGFVYVFAGLRGRDSNTSAYTGNAPWGVTDLKAAVRFVRYNTDVLPGDTDRMFVFGHSGGGAQSSVMGSSGDSALYLPYLKSLGAAMRDRKGRVISDAIAGVMAWCPITSLDYANAAYEWNLGQFASSGTRAAGTWTAAYSADLADAFAAYTNQLRLKSGRTTLKLQKSADGRYLAGSYYDHLMSVIETSLNDFLSDTTFPYTPSSASMPGMGGGSAPSGGTPPSGGTAPGGGSMPSGGSSSSSTTYATVSDYIASLNADTTWIRYDAASNTAKVLSLEGFVNSQKSASKDVGAFDGISRQETENVVLGSGTDGLHFSPVSRAVIAANQSRYAAISDWKSSYAAGEYTSDFKKQDSIGRTVIDRSNMYNPMYFLSRHYDGYRSSTVAPLWRIRTGIMQGDTANTVEVNLALALANAGISDVDFATVWGQGHTMAERTGDATTNFIAWVTSGVKRL